MRRVFLIFFLIIAISQLALAPPVVPVMNFTSNINNPTPQVSNRDLLIEINQTTYDTEVLLESVNGTTLREMKQEIEGLEDDNDELFAYFQNTTNILEDLGINLTSINSTIISEIGDLDSQFSDIDTLFSQVFDNQSIIYENQIEIKQNLTVNYDALVDLDLDVSNMNQSQFLEFVIVNTKLSEINTTLWNNNALLMEINATTLLNIKQDLESLLLEHQELYTYHQNHSAALAALEADFDELFQYHQNLTVLLSLIELDIDELFQYHQNNSGAIDLIDSDIDQLFLYHQNASTILNDLNLDNDEIFNYLQNRSVFENEVFTYFQNISALLADLDLDIIGLNNSMTLQFTDVDTLFSEVFANHSILYDQQQIIRQNITANYNQLIDIDGDIFNMNQSQFLEFVIVNTKLNLLNQSLDCLETGGAGCTWLSNEIDDVPFQVWEHPNRTNVTLIGVEITKTFSKVEVVGTIYGPDDEIQIYTGCRNSTNFFDDLSFATLDLRYPNNTLWLTNESMVAYGSGLFNYSSVRTDPTIRGTYPYKITCYFYSTGPPMTVAEGIGDFQVPEWIHNSSDVASDVDALLSEEHGDGKWVGIRGSHSFFEELASAGVTIGDIKAAYEMGNLMYVIYWWAWRILAILLIIFAFRTVYDWYKDGGFNK